MNTENIINKLCNDLETVKPLPHPLLRAQPWLMLIIGYIIIASSFIGIRPDIATISQKTTFIFEVLISAAIGISAFIATFWSTIPDMRGEKWIISIPFAFLTIFSLWMISRIISEEMHIHHYDWHSCFGKGLLLTTIPIALSVFIAKKAATTHAYLTTSLSALSASAFGFIALRLTCMVETIEHCVLHHITPFLLVGIVVVTLAKRLYKW